MTPADKTKFKSFAQVRTLVLNPEIKEKLIDSEYYIEGMPRHLRDIFCLRQKTVKMF